MEKHNTVRQVHQQKKPLNKKHIMSVISEKNSQNYQESQIIRNFKESSPPHYKFNDGSISDSKEKYIDVGVEYEYEMMNQVLYEDMDPFDDI